jgi:hypothetical protein
VLDVHHGDEGISPRKPLLWLLLKVTHTAH